MSNAIGYKKFLFRPVYLAALLIFAISFSALPAHANGPDDPAAPYDEILIFMNVQGVGNIQVPAAIRNEVAYLSVTDVFDFLKIRNLPSAESDSISGFFINPQSAFVIDAKNNTITYQGKRIALPVDALIHTAGIVYLRSDIFGQVFGLQCRFNFRSLSVVVSTDLELPVIREMRQEAMRNNLGRLKGEMKADTVIGRSYPLYKFGAADWSVINTVDRQLPSADTRLLLGLGGVLAGGETNVLLNYRSGTPFREREQYYQWRFADNDNSALRQVTAGKLYTPTVSSIYSPVVGVQLTNAPTYYRRSFGTYTLTYYTEAGWIAELYVNNTLVDYSKADATGLAHFQVPLVYGNSVVKIRFYSPWGEERTSEQNIQIPFNFLPAHEFEYSATAGMVEDSSNSRLGRITGNYGLNSRMTIGGGVEYLSAVTTGKFIPFVNSSFRATTNLLFSAEYAYGVRTKLVGSYHLHSDLQVDLNYTRYVRGQKAINNTFLEERKVVLSYPFRSKRFTLFSRLSVYEVVLPNINKTPNTKYTTVEGLLSGVIAGVNTNLVTYALLTDQSQPFVYSSLSAAIRIPGKMILTPQLQYDYNHLKPMDIKTELGKYISSRGYVNIYYENNYKSAFSSVGIGFRYDFSFGISGLSVVRGNHNTGNSVQSASGSLLYDDAAKRISLSNRSSVGKAAIRIQPYLDLNNNGERDAGEPAVMGVNVSINAGRLHFNKSDSSMVVTDLEPYINYTLKLTEAFENIAWHVRNKTISITGDPNQVKLLEIPVTILHEVAGTVYLFDAGKEKPMGRIKISFYNRDYRLAGEVITEPDGSFSYSGLTPGSYSAQINAGQLEHLHMKATPWSLPFTIAAKRNGDFVDGLRFVIQPL